MILDGHSAAAIDRAAGHLAAGELVAFPTETVYGLGADADNDAAVAKVFAAKGRPSDHPLIVHVAEPEAAVAFAREVPPVARRLTEAFWPGPLTVILPRAPGRAGPAAGGQSSIGLRCPAHPVAHALLRAARDLQPAVTGVAAPSANRFGRVSPTTAAHVESEFGADLWVLDGGPCQVGIESAIVDCTRGVPVLLRPGTLTQARIAAVAGERLWLPHEMADAAPRASGTLASHYAPQARVRLMDAKALQAGLDVLGDQARNMAVWSRSALRSASRELVLRRMPDDPATAARELFAVLRAFDEAGVALIWIEEPPDRPEWAGVHDRLRRAAAT